MCLLCMYCLCVEWVCETAADLCDWSVRQVLCVLPKTCHNSFGGNQPVFTHWEVAPGQGGSYGLDYQVDPPTPP